MIALYLDEKISTTCPPWEAVMSMTGGGVLSSGLAEVGGGSRKVLEYLYSHRVFGIRFL